MRQRWVILVLGGIFASFAHSVNASTLEPPREDFSSSPRLDLRIDPLVDLHYMIRKYSAIRSDTTDSRGLSELQGFANACKAAERLDEELGNPLAWGLIEGVLIEAENAAQAVELFGSLPDSFRMRFGDKVALREHAVHFAEALAEVEAEFLSTVWPEHRRSLQRIDTFLSATLLPKQAECFAYILHHLGMQDPGVSIPVYLVAESPFPHGFTHRQRGGGGVCFVGIDGHEGSRLFEVILHESTHALETAAGNEGTVLLDLRGHFREAGLKKGDHVLHDIYHTLMFIHTAETVRRILDPSHVHYGVAGGYYRKVGDIADVELPIWTAYLDGEIDRIDAVGTIAVEIIKGLNARSRNR